MEDIQTKVCSDPKCEFKGQPQPVSNFHKSKKTSDGFYYSCKKCKRGKDKERVAKTQKEFWENPPEHLECTRCKELRLLINFHKQSTSKNGLSHICKFCKSAEDRIYREEHSEQIKKSKQDYYAKNREKENERNRKWMEENIDKWKEWYERTKEERNLKRRKRYAENPVLSVINCARVEINRLYKKGELSRSERPDSTARVVRKNLGISSSGFKKYIDSTQYPHPETGEEMTDDNYGKDWDLDHIIPRAAFNQADPEQFKYCWNYKNFQAKWKKENQSKSAKILTEEFEDWHFETCQRFGIDLD